MCQLGSTYFTQINLLKTHKSPMRYVLWLSPLNRWKSWGTGRVSNLSSITQLAHSRAGNQSQTSWLWNAHSNHSDPSPTAVPSLSLVSLLFPQTCQAHSHLQTFAPAAFSIRNTLLTGSPFPLNLDSNVLSFQHFSNIFRAFLPFSLPTSCFFFLLSTYHFLTYSILFILLIVCLSY